MTDDQQQQEYERRLREAESAAHNAISHADREAYRRISEGWRQLLANLLRRTQKPN